MSRRGRAMTGPQVNLAARREQGTTARGASGGPIRVARLVLAAVAVASVVAAAVAILVGWHPQLPPGP